MNVHDVIADVSDGDGSSSAIRAGSKAPEATRKIFSARLRLFQQNNFATLEEFQHDILTAAKLSTRSKQTVRKWLAGESLPSGLTLDHVARFIGFESADMALDAAVSDEVKREITRMERTGKLKPRRNDMVKNSRRGSRPAPRSAAAGDVEAVKTSAPDVAPMTTAPVARSVAGRGKARKISGGAADVSIGDEIAAATSAGASMEAVAGADAGADSLAEHFPSVQSEQASAPVALPLAADQPTAPARRAPSTKESAALEIAVMRRGDGSLCIRVRGHVDAEFAVSNEADAALFSSRLLGVSM